jgi:hypothetical protein
MYGFWNDLDNKDSPMVASRAFMHAGAGSIGQGICPPTLQRRRADPDFAGHIRH